MKKILTSLFVIVLLLVLASCKNERETFESATYYPDNSLSNEHIVLKNTAYNDDSYTTTISGSVYVKADSKIVEIKEQELNLIQEYGNIWYSFVEITGLENELVYFHRLGENPLSGSKSLLINEDNNDYITALLFEHYANVNFIIFRSTVYLL